MQLGGSSCYRPEIGKAHGFDPEGSDFVEFADAVWFVLQVAFDVGEPFVPIAAVGF